ncbi:MAG TPA: low molecular weight phosphatase family protein [Candidatus Acidoferrales bacterium]|nr:low molecular weight phosphatase family protein [Candidatus Acidoferrales bacterium]
MRPMPQPVKVLFVCVGNCVRSQMAEAIARRDSSDIIEAESAGVSPLGFIDNTTQTVLRERGISFEGQFSKGLRTHTLKKPDLIVNMSGIPGASLFAGQRFEDWQVQDPFGEAIETHRRICDDIEGRIKDLAARLRQAQTKQPAPETRLEGASS